MSRNGHGNGPAHSDGDPTARRAIEQTLALGTRLGMSLFPPRQDGTKAPRTITDPETGKPTWGPFQEAPPGPELIEQWYDREACTGVGCACGTVSAGRPDASLNVLDFDDGAIHERYRERAAEVGLADVLERAEAGYSERTPGGGVHVYAIVPVEGGETWPNSKLAERPDPGRPKGSKTLIETKCEGGFIIMAPTFGTVHESGKPYVRLRGGLDTIAEITADEWRALCDLAASFDEMPVETVREPRPRRSRAAGDGGAATLPGDDFAARTTWQDLLEGAGWRHVYTRGDTSYWRRPGKAIGISASLNHGDADTFYPFTTSSEFPPRKGYSKFGFYATHDHGGDFSAAARALARDGYGTFQTWVEVEADAGRKWRLETRPNPCPKGVRIARPGEGPPGGPGRDGPTPSDATGDGDGGGDGPHAGAGGEGPTGADAGPAPERPRIEINPERHLVVEATIAAIAGDPGLYYRGEMLVIVARQEDDSVKLTARTALRRMAGSPRILELSDANVGCLLTRNAEFFGWQEGRNGGRAAARVHPPEWLTRAVASRKFWPGVRNLVSVVECPYPKADGTIVETPGYDPETGTLYIPSTGSLPLPGHPTREDAEAAWKTLRGVFREFPFASEDDRVVPLATLLTVMARPAIEGPVPGTAFVANKAGTGKGLLINSIGRIAYDRDVATSSYPDGRDEAKKVKVSIALQAPVAVHFDNLDEGTSYGGSALDSMLTATTINDRILGASKNTGELPVRVVAMLSGNNVSPGKDAHRRWLVCNLASDLERPEEREDIEVKDLKAHVGARRGELVRAALTILKAHAIAGRPTNPDWAPLGSFEEWDRVVRGAVWFATGRDCCATRRKAADDSPARKAKIALLVGWSELPGGTTGGVTAAQAVKLAEAEPAMYATLHNALMHFGKAGKIADPRGIGNTIRGMKGSLTEGMKFVEAGDDCRAVLWKVVKSNIKPPSPRDLSESGESDESDFSPCAGDNRASSSSSVYARDAHTHQDGSEGHSLDSPDSSVDPEDEVSRL